MIGVLQWLILCSAFYVGSRWGRARGRTQGRAERFTEDTLIEESDEFWRRMREER